MRLPKVSIIILNWNGWQDTLECLESLAKINYPHYEVIVADNASEDDSVKRIKDWKKKKLIKNFSLIENNKNYGFAEGNNITIRQVLKEKQSPYILLLNNDTVVDKNFLNELVKTAEERKKCGIVGSKIYYYPPKRRNIVQSSGAGINLKTGRLASYGDGKTDSQQFKKIKKVDYVYGTSMLIKREVFEKIGLFDEKFFAIAEDADLCLRAKKAGCLTFCAPLSKIWHKSEVSIKKIPGFSAYYRTRNLIWLVKKHTTTIEFLFFAINYLIFQFPRTIYRSCFKKRQETFPPIKKNPFRLLTSYLRGLKDGIFG